MYTFIDVELADEDFKVVIISMFNVPKKTMFKELKESMTTMNSQYRFSIRI